MTKSEIREHAARLIEAHNEEYEFCLVYEDEDLCDVSPEDQRAILDAMYEAKIQIDWK